MNDAVISQENSLISEKIHFVTGRLAEQSLRDEARRLAARLGFDYTIGVMPITVAALMTPEWIARHVEAPPETTRILIPGYCGGDLTELQHKTGVPVERGPRDLRRLPEFFGQTPTPADYGEYDIEILAEINHCPRLSLQEILAEAHRLADDGADLIDMGCEPGKLWNENSEAVAALKAEGFRVSIDSMDSREIESAVRAGAELVLSVNSSNREAAVDWGCEVVAVPDEPKTLTGLDDTIEYLAKHCVPLRVDPILEPIAFGFADSLGRYINVRERYPDAQMMMGIGNLTELTDVDSAGLNVLLLGFCQELGIRSVLTTQVIHWAKTSVRECDIGRRLVHHAVNHRVMPKHLDNRLLMLRDESVVEPSEEELERLARQLKDNNYRVFTAAGKVHLVAKGLHLADADPFLLMRNLLSSGPDGKPPKNLDAIHSFYLGYELCKATTALTLGKQYQQDEALDWGFLTEPEERHYLKERPWPDDVE